MPRDNAVSTNRDDPRLERYSAETLKAARQLIGRLGGDERHLSHVCIALDTFLEAQRQQTIAALEALAAERDLYRSRWLATTATWERP